MQNNIEIWKPVVGYENIYEVSNFGRVKSLQRTCIGAWGKPRIVKEKILSVSNDTKGYPRTVLTYKSKMTHKRVHVLVAMAFIPNPESKPFVNHINGIKTDSFLENLEWCTKSENELHAYKTGLKKSGNIGSKCHCSKFTKEEAEQIRNEYTPKRGVIAILARKYGVKWDTISQIVKGISYAE